MAQVDDDPYQLDLPSDVDDETTQRAQEKKYMQQLQQLGKEGRSRNMSAATRVRLSGRRVSDATQPPTLPPLSKKNVYPTPFDAISDTEVSSTHQREERRSLFDSSKTNGEVRQDMSKGPIDVCYTESPALQNGHMSSGGARSTGLRLVSPQRGSRRGTGMNLRQEIEDAKEREKVKETDEMASLLSPRSEKRSKLKKYKDEAYIYSTEEELFAIFSLCMPLQGRQLISKQHADDLDKIAAAEETFQAAKTHYQRAQTKYKNGEITDGEMTKEQEVMDAAESVYQSQSKVERDDCAICTPGIGDEACDRRIQSALDGFRSALFGSSETARRFGMSMDSIGSQFAHYAIQHYEHGMQEYMLERRQHIQASALSIICSQHYQSIIEASNRNKYIEIRTNPETSAQERIYSMGLCSKNNAPGTIFHTKFLTIVRHPETSEELILYTDTARIYAHHNYRVAQHKRYYNVFYLASNYNTVTVLNTYKNST